MRRQRREQPRAEAFEDALRGHRVDDATLARESAELVLVAEAILRAEHPEPDDAFVTGLRRRMLTEAGDVLVADAPVVHVRPARRRHSPRRRAAALVAAFVVSLGSVGMISTSAQALPGESLYPVKRTVEGVELSLQRGPVGTGRKQLELATERLAEIDALTQGRVDARGATLVDKTFDDFVGSARAGSAQLLAAYQASGTSSAVETVDAFVGTSSRLLARLQSRLPTSSTQSFGKAARVVHVINDDTRKACSDCATAGAAAAVADLLERDRVPVADAPVRIPTAAATVPAPPRAGVLPTGRPAATPTAQAPATVAPTATPATPLPSEVPGEVRDPLRSLTDPLLGGLLGTPAPAAPSETPSPGADPTPGGLVPGLLDGVIGESSGTSRGAAAPGTTPTP